MLLIAKDRFLLIKSTLFAVLENKLYVLKFILSILIENYVFVRFGLAEDFELSPPNLDNFGGWKPLL